MITPAKSLEIMYPSALSAPKLIMSFLETVVRKDSFASKMSMILSYAKDARKCKTGIRYKSFEIFSFDALMD